METIYTVKDEKALELLRRYQNGDNTAFDRLYNLYLPMLVNYGHCLTRDKELLEDCIHDVFIKLLNRSSKTAMKCISSYLIISLRNRIVDEYRHDSFTIDTPVEECSLRRYTDSVDADYIKDETAKVKLNALDSMLSTLTPRQRMAFQLYYLEEKKYGEVCKIMNLNYPSVRNLVHRGMLRLRKAAQAI